jgi:hypothetical protein
LQLPIWGDSAIAIAPLGDLAIALRDLAIE